VVPATDVTLVLGVLNGDRSAFAELYDRRARLIRGICLDATHDLHAAADLTQEVFLRAYTGLKGLRDPQFFTPWLAGIAHQACREWRRGKLRDRSCFTGLAQAQTTAAAEELQDERLDLLRGALAELPEQERLSLHAFYLQELDAEQARTVLGLSRSGFYHVLTCARQRLRRILARQEVRP
jgi:RNA polymerase sigma-70 factor, ECF subfamily